MIKDNYDLRKFRCAACGSVFELSVKDRNMKCPSCRSRILILLEGPSLSRSDCLKR